MHNMTTIDSSKMEFIDLECSKKILHEFQKCSFLLISIFAAKQVTALHRDCSHTAMAQFPAPHILNMVNLAGMSNGPKCYHLDCNNKEHIWVRGVRISSFDSTSNFEG